eukprot:2516588-Pyramimonas_sp.AAC.1
MNGFKRAGKVSAETTEPNQWLDGYDRAADDSPKGCIMHFRFSLQTQSLQLVQKMLKMLNSGFGFRMPY